MGICPIIYCRKAIEHNNGLLLVSNQCIHYSIYGSMIYICSMKHMHGYVHLLTSACTFTSFEL